MCADNGIDSWRAGQRLFPVSYNKPSRCVVQQLVTSPPAARGEDCVSYTLAAKAGPRGTTASDSRASTATRASRALVESGGLSRAGPRGCQGGHADPCCGPPADPCWHGVSTCHPCWGAMLGCHAGVPQQKARKCHGRRLLPLLLSRPRARTRVSPEPRPAAHQLSAYRLADAAACQRLSPRCVPALIAVPHCVPVLDAARRRRCRTYRPIACAARWQQRRRSDALIASQTRLSRPRAAHAS